MVTGELWASFLNQRLETRDSSRFDVPLVDGERGREERRGEGREGREVKRAFPGRADRGEGRMGEGRGGGRKFF